MGKVVLRWALLAVLAGSLVGAFAVVSGDGSAVAADPVAGAPAASPKVLGEEVDRRTATSETFRLAGGGHQTRLFAAPVNYLKAGGDWAPIDLTLKSDGSGGLETTANSDQVSLPGSLDDPAEVTDGSGRSVSFALRGAAASSDAQPDGASATYEDVRPGVDATYDALSTGVKETLTLGDASAPSSYIYDLEASSGLSPSLRADGSVVFRDGGDRVRFSVPAPTVQEAGGAPSTAHVAYTLASDGLSLAVKVDPDWLSGASFPVKVDPSLFSFDTDACTLSNGSLASTAACGSTVLKVGNDGSHVQRAALRVPSLDDAGIPNDASILFAELFLTVKGMSDPSQHPIIDVAPLTKQLQNGATWNTYDGATSWVTPGGDVGTPASYSGNPVDGTSTDYDVHWGITAVAESWVRSQNVNGSNASTNFGLLVRARDESVHDVTSFGGPAAGSQWQVPSVEIEWAARPGIEADQTYESIGLADRSAMKVNLATGNLAVQSNDIHLAGVDGLDLSVSRTFNGEDLGDGHVFGSAWQETVGGASTRMAFDGYNRVHRLTANGGAVYRYDPVDANVTGSPTFRTPAGIDGKLVETSTAGAATVTFTDGRVWRYSAPVDGTQELTQIKDVHGNHIDLAYADPADANSLSQITDTYGNVLQVNRDSSGTLTGVTDAQGRHWSYGVAATHRVLNSFADADSKTTSYTYDTSNPDVWDKLVQITDARGRQIKFAYDGTHGDYSQVTRVTLVRDGTAANDVTWNFDYQPASATGHSCSDATNGRTVETDPRGKLTTYCHDSQGHVQTWDALGRQQKRGYNAQANVTDVATTAGGTGNPLSLSYASDATHNLTGGTEPAGASFALSYCMTPGSSSNGCSGGVAGDLAQSSVRQYRDEQATKTDYDYNATGDLTSVRADASPAVAGLVLAYNSDGTIKSSTDGNGNVTNYAYTGHNLTSVTPPAASTLIGATTLTYDAQNRVKTVTDGLGTVATVTYDLEDRVTQVSYSNGRSFSVGYDANGNATSRNERSGSTIVNTTTYSYDSLNRRISETFPGSQTNSYGYDKTSNLVSVTDGSGTSTYAYDDINRLQSVSSPKTGTADCASSPGSCDAISYAYSDLAGSAATANGGATSRVTATYPGSLTQVTQANASGAPTSQAVKNPAGTVLQGFAYAYLTGGGTQQALISAITQQPSNNKTAYSYDVAKAQTSGALLSAITKNGSGSTVEGWSYGYDGAGNARAAPTPSARRPPRPATRSTRPTRCAGRLPAQAPPRAPAPHQGPPATPMTTPATAPPARPTMR